MPKRQTPRAKPSPKPTIATYLQRAKETRDELTRVLIVCEGEKTEPNYFRALAATIRLSVDVRIEGLGDNTDSLVERAINLEAQGDYDQAWCVFDRDSFPAGRFNRAIELATNGGFRVAYSNEAFELWYVLHFEYLQTGLPRDDYIKKLDRHLDKRYRKHSLSIYEELLTRQPTAIRHATRLLTIYDPPSPERDNPSTTVHLLVQELHRLRRG